MTNPKDPQAELHKLFRQICLRWNENQPHADPYHAYDKIYEEFAPKFEALFQAHQQELLSELLGAAIDYDLVTYDFGTALVVGKQKAVPVSVINRKIGELNG